MLLCCRQKCVNTLTMFKRNVKGLYQEGKLHRILFKSAQGVQWLSGGVLDSGPRVMGSSLTSFTALCP